jgi:hypothetical protein
MKTILILGNITFDTKPKHALVHEINGVLLCENSIAAQQIGEEICNDFGAYLIPEIWDGSITYEDQAQIELIKSLQLQDIKL